MRELRDKGTTVLLVSHDMSSVRDLCERAVYLRQGRLVYFGDSKKAISLYYQEAHSTDNNTAGQCSTPSPGKPSTDLITNFLEGACWIRGSDDPIDPIPAKILGVAVLDARYEPTMKVRVGDELIIQMLFQAHRDYACSTSLMIKNRFDQVVNCCGTYTCGIEPHFFRKGETGLFEFRIRCMLEAGLYSFQVTLGSEGPLPNRGCDVDSSPWLGPVHMDWDYQNERAPFLGMFGIPVSAKYLNHETSDDL
jgi:lipopolysaccharide transport system ATP-binding protein